MQTYPQPGEVLDADDDREPWQDHYSTPPPCEPDLDEWWDEAYYYGEY